MYLEPHDYRIYYVNIDLRHQYGISAAESQTFLLTVVVVVGSPTKDLLESMGCLLRDTETVYAISQMLTETTIDSVRN